MSDAANRRATRHAKRLTRRAGRTAARRAIRRELFDGMASGERMIRRTPRDASELGR